MGRSRLVAQRWLTIATIIAKIISALAIAAFAHSAAGCSTSLPPPPHDAPPAATTDPVAIETSPVPAPLPTVDLDVPATPAKGPAPLRVWSPAIGMTGQKLSSDVLRGKIRPTTKLMVPCYDLKLNESLSVFAKFDVNDDGSVANVETRMKEPKVAAVEACVADTLATIKFPVLPGGAVKVKVHYNFRRGSGGASSKPPTSPPRPRRHIVLAPSTVFPLDAQSLVHDLVRRKTRDFERCYASARTRTPELQGEVRVEFTIDPHGGVHVVKASVAPKHDSLLARCIQRTIQSIVFKDLGRRLVTVKQTFKLRR